MARNGSLGAALAIVAPLLLAAALALHPRVPAAPAADFIAAPERWLLAHALQVPLVAAAGAALAWLVRGRAGAAAWTCRAAAAAFAVASVALAATDGLATGVLARHAAALPDPERAAVAAAIDALFAHRLVGGSGSVLAALAALSWLTGALAAAVALARARANPAVPVLLAASGALFLLGHVPPAGPLAMLAFAAAAALVAISARRPAP